MTCVYDDTLQDDCTTPVSTAVVVSSSSNLFYLPGLTSPDSSNPVATQAATSTPTGLSSVLNFFSSIAAPVTTAITGSNTTSGLRLQVNPATGLQQYFNPATNQYVGSPITSTSAFGGSSFLLIIGALVIAFFAFGGRKKLATA